MKWDTYKKVCDEPSVLSRWLIQQTAQVCDSDHAELLLEYLCESPLEKPSDHKGTSEVDMFRTYLTYDQVQRIVSFVSQQNDQTSGSVRRYKGIALAWVEYLRSLDQSSND